MNKWKNKTTWCWTNWTFGFYYDKLRYSKYFGIDLGPLEIYWTKRLR